MRRRAGTVTLAVVLAALVLLGMRFADDGLVYYRTPSEVLAVAADDSTMRLSGLVVTGSVARSDQVSSFVLTDGAADVTVQYVGMLPATVHEGEGAVVEGRLMRSGVFHADDVLLRHSNEYRPETHR